KTRDRDRDQPDHRRDAVKLFDKFVSRLDVEVIWIATLHVTAATQDLFRLGERFLHHTSAAANNEQCITSRRCDLLRGAERNVDRVIFVVLAEESGLTFLEDADDFEVVTTHAHLRARN